MSITGLLAYSYKGLYNYMYSIGKEWTSPNHGMPEKNYACLVKIQSKKELIIIQTAYFSEQGWIDSSQKKIEENWEFIIIEWKYAPKTDQHCSIL